MTSVERTVNYRCSDDCLQSGCPSHEGKLIFQSVSDAYTFMMKGREMSFERNELQAMLDLLGMLERCDAVAVPTVGNLRA